MAEKASSEHESLRISQTEPDAVPLSELERLKRRKRRMEKQELTGYCAGQTRLSAFRKAQMCLGFDFFPLEMRSRQVRPVQPIWGDDYGITLYGKLGLHCYNFQQGTNFKLVRWEKYYRDRHVVFYCGQENPGIYYYITLDAMDPATNAVFSFQTLVSDGSKGGIFTRLRTLASRFRCKEPVNFNWDYSEIDEIDEFYKGKMPQWFSDHDLATDPKRFYEVQESDLLDNDFLQLFSEIAIWKLEDCKFVGKIKKIVIETKEEYKTEAREKLKAKNAIYYITYNYPPGHPSFDSSDDYTAILRKTMDGEPGHMCIEVADEETEYEEERIGCGRLSRTETGTGQ